MVAQLVVPLASWGWWLKSIPQQKAKALDSAVHTALWCGDTTSAVPLRHLFLGHTLSVDFQAHSSALKFWQLANVAIDRPGSPPLHSTKWWSVIDRWLRKQGWEFVHLGPFWRHSEFPQIHVHQRSDDPAASVSRHAIRHVWRFTLLNMFFESDRRETNLFSRCIVDTPTLDRTRKIFQEQDGHAREVILAGAFSDAAFGIASVGQVPTQCAWCGTHAIPTWDHLAWNCSFFKASRPQLPKHPVQRRLGWFCTNDHRYNQSVLHHLAQVRMEGAFFRHPNMRGHRVRETLFVRP